MKVQGRQNKARIGLGRSNNAREGHRRQEKARAGQIISRKAWEGLRRPRKARAGQPRKAWEYLGNPRKFVADRGKLVTCQFIFFYLLSLLTYF